MTDDRRVMAYQVRIGPGSSPEDVVTKLTQAVWRVLSEAKGADPHRWPDLYTAFKKVFIRRLRLHQECGTLGECRFSEGRPGDSGGGAGPKDRIYILSLRGGLMQFVEGLGALGWRMFRPDLSPSGAKKRAALSRFYGAIHRALSENLYYNEMCSECRIRKNPPDRRFWESRTDARSMDDLY